MNALAGGNGLSLAIFLFQVNPFLKATRGMFLTALPAASVATNKWEVTGMSNPSPPIPAPLINQPT